MKMRKLTDIETGLLLGTVIAIIISNIFYAYSGDAGFFILIILGAGLGFLLGAGMNRKTQLG
ncbi:MAG: hypothetical protein A4E32_01450 [Methanomassiliicoccales archaeon PtaU1.Bin124]|nr:MAG: hypothetical protein A4E32_01450 [Methanomassiliicoccales archaeon PtaU1.Bin124]